MDKKKIVILGTMDTKGEHITYLQKRIENRGHETILIDLSTGHEHSWRSDISSREIAAIGGEDIENLIRLGDRARAADAMLKGAESKVLELLNADEISGIVALGGVTLANIASAIMQKMPFGIPKALGVPAVMPVFTSQWLGATDIVVIQIIMDISGMNDLLKSGIDRLSGIIAGMVEEAAPYTSLKLAYPSIAITEYRFSQKCAFEVRRVLEEMGYYAFSFSAQGIGDRAMEKLIRQGFIHGVVDIVPSGLSDELTGGRRSAGRDRLCAAAEMGIPQVIAPAGINMTGCGSTRPKDQEKYNSRSRILKIDELRWMTRYTPEELREHAKIYAEKLTKARGPTVFVFPLKGWSSADTEGSILYDPKEDGAFIDELKKYLKSEIEILEIDCNLDEAEFGRVLAENFDRIFRVKNRQLGRRGR
jgi:uncharacterized protein (UPF0261 family)